MAGTIIGGGNPIMDSRYAPKGSVTNTPDKKESGSSSGTSGQSGGSTSAGTSTSNTNQTQTTNSKTQNMDPTSMAALEKLIAMLMGGGTADMKAQRQVRETERDKVGQIRQGYSKENAFGDAQGLIAQQMRRALEQMMPSISRAAEDAGSSGGALRALLMQDAADKASESSSALGVKTAVDYGNITSNLSQILERLTTPDNSSVNALIGALGVAKGATSSTQGTVNTTGTTTTNENKAVTENRTGFDNKNQTASTDYAPFNVSSRSPGGSNMPVYYGPVDDRPARLPIGSTEDLLSQLYGGGSAWSGYKF